MSERKEDKFAKSHQMWMDEMDDLENEFFEMSFESYFFVDGIVVEKSFVEKGVFLRLKFSKFLMRRRIG